MPLPPFTSLVPISVNDVALSNDLNFYCQCLESGDSILSPLLYKDKEIKQFAENVKEKARDNATLQCFTSKIQQEKEDFQERLAKLRYQFHHSVSMEVERVEVERLFTLLVNELQPKEN